MTIRIALGVALVLAASVPARAAARFLVGASAADITPPLAATAASNPADCDASGLYNGAHLFSLEEPYYKKVYVNGVEQPQAPNGSEQGNQVKTDLGWFMIGDAEFVTTPGELFPFTYVHDFSGPDDLRVPQFGPVHGWVMATLTARWRFIEGLGEDMLGYIFPRSNAVGVPTASNPSPDDTDRFGCGHSDDGEAAAEAAGTS